MLKRERAALVQNACENLFRLSVVVAVLWQVFPPEILQGAGCKNPVKIVWEPYEPFQAGPPEKVTGYDLELIKTILEKMGCKSDFIKAPFARQVRLIEEGSVDMGAGFSLNPERKKVM